jgi:hypothetical protein
MKLNEKGQGQQVDLFQIFRVTANRTGEQIPHANATVAQRFINPSQQQDNSGYLSDSSQSFAWSHERIYICLTIHILDALPYL